MGFWLWLLMRYLTFLGSVPSFKMGKMEPSAQDLTG